MGFHLRTEFGPQTIGGVVEKRADLGREVAALRMHDVYR
jgi:hypothetical protein